MELALTNLKVKDNVTITDDTKSEFDSSKIYIVDVSGEGDYTNLSDALSAGAINIYIKNGVYEISNTILIDRDGVSIVGESQSGVQFIQTNSERDLLVVKADNVTIKKITLDTRTHDAQAAMVEAGANFLSLEESTILGGTKIFALYFAAHLSVL